MSSVTIEGILKRDSGRAILVDIQWIDGRSYDGEPVWFPKSKVDYDPEDAEPGEEIEAEVPEWLADENDLL